MSNIPSTEGYRCQAYPIHNNTNINGLQFFTTDEEIIHHSLVYLSEAGYQPPNDTNEAFNCSYSGTEEWGLIGGWRPGAPPVDLSEDMGVPISDDQYLIVQVYYTPPTNVSPETDFENPDFYWGFRYEDAVEKELKTERIANFDILIPADETNHIESAQHVWNSGKGQLVGLLPRTHLYGTGIDAELQKADETQCLFHIEGYDFGMPHMLLFSDTIEVENGDVINFNCRWDNSDENDRQMKFPPADVFPGYAYDEAVCYLDFLWLPSE
jgi:hypothetical protein